MKDHLREAVRLEWGGSTLWSVPAVHFRAAFAKHVNEAARRLRPEAVAVELGPATAGAAVAWLRELRASGRAARLPRMLGLVKTNARIRPSKRETALRIQEATGKDLHELPPALLKRLLGYSAVRVLYLSPTDSIIEAIRCGLECEAPIYGIDLEESAERQPHEGMLRDPALAWDDLGAYVAGNAAAADTHRDEEIDDRREVAMAARLKTLLTRHRSVLLTGGLAHWQRLQDLLADERIKPAPAEEASQCAAQGWQRVVVHPLLAIHHLDAFPAIATAYEETRKPASEDVRFAEMMPPAQIFTKALVKVYEAHFQCDAGGQQLDRRLEDWEARGSLEQLLTHLCVVRQLSTPDLFTALAAAEGTMSPAFCRALAEELMRCPWAGPNDFPDLRILAPAPAGPGEPIAAELSDKEGRHGRAFYIDPLPGHGGGTYVVHVPVPWQWEQQGTWVDRSKAPTNRYWSPRDYLKSAMSARAIEVAKDEPTRIRIDPFEGGMLDGLDWKTSIRAHIRGDERFYVRDVRRTVRTGVQADTDGFPVVWILRPGEDDAYSLHATGNLLDDVAGHVHDRQRLEEVRQADGGYLITLVDYSNSYFDDQLRIGGQRVECHDSRGVLLFSPLHFEFEQHAVWIEATRYQRNPIVRSYSYSGLRQLYRDKHGFDPQEHPWPLALVLMAVPYALRTVTVVVPDGYGLPGYATQFAARRGKRIRCAPLSFFPREQIRKMATDYVVPWVGGESGHVFPEEVERVLGESQHAYQNFVPSKWLHFGKRKAQA